MLTTLMLGAVFTAAILAAWLALCLLIGTTWALAERRGARHDLVRRALAAHDAYERDLRSLSTADPGMDLIRATREDPPVNLAWGACRCGNWRATCPVHTAAYWRDQLSRETTS